MTACETVFLYRDNEWLIVNKPTGISTHSANPGDLGIVEWLNLHHDLKVYVCSRLDKGTSGVLVFALTREASGMAENIHEKGSAKKTYYFISDQKSPKGKNWRCRKKLDEKNCETFFELEKEGNGFFLYRAEIIRGRKHQIRRHAFISGVPILGDTEYKGKPFPRLCLHCEEVSWPGVRKNIVAKLPQSFEWLMTGQEMMMVEAAIAIERRQNWLFSITNAFRLVHRGEIQGLPFAIDLLGEWSCVTGFDEGLSAETLRKKIAPVLKYFSGLFKLRGGVVRGHRKNPHQRKLLGDRVSWGETPPDKFLVKEHDLSFEVTLNESQHTGLFLDQRDSRRRIGKISPGKRVANLFSFTCSFSVVSAKSGSEVVFSVDQAAVCLEKGKHNFKNNGIAEWQGPQSNGATAPGGKQKFCEKAETLQAYSTVSSGCGKFIKEDVRKWLDRQSRKKKADPDAFDEWDVVICDPPVFASSGKGRSFSVEKEWSRLAKNIREILSEKGIALFANNHRSGNEKFYFSELRKHFSKVTRFRPPFDFPELSDPSNHVRIYWCEV